MSARNVVEQIFGILKRCFVILTIPPEFSMAIQARIPPALCVVHNFIRIHDPDEIHDFKIHDEHVDIEPHGELAPGPAGRQEIAWGTA
jgi:hypothetical protein